jgi:hypothetical protein
VLRVRWQRTHLVAAVLVAGLHAVLLYASLSAGWTARPPSAVVEFVTLRPLRPPPLPLPRDTPVDVFRGLAGPSVKAPSYAIANVPVMPAPGAFPRRFSPGESNSALLAAIGRSLGCSYASYDGVSDKEGCAARLAGQTWSGSFALTAHELWLNAHFATALAARNSPILLPCMSAEGAGPSLAMLICLANGVANGFARGADGIPTYADQESDEYPNKPAAIRF